MLDSVAAVHRARHKRVKCHNDSVDYIYSSGNTVLADHINTEERTSENVIDYTDVFALSDVLQDDGKYGSVTKDFEAVNAQQMDVLNRLAAIQTSFSTPCSDSQAYKVSPANLSSSCQQGMELIDLEEHREQENGRGNDITSAIVVDSDDDDGSGYAQNTLPSTSDPGRDFRAWMSSQIDLRLRKNRLSAGEANSLHQLSDEQGISVEVKRLPSIQFEKVVLKNVNENDLAANLEKPIVRRETEGEALASVSNHQKPIVRRETEGEALASVSNTKKNRTIKCARGGIEGNALSIDANVEKKTMVSSSAMSAEDACYYTTPSLVAHHDDSEIPESDGLEDLWKDMSVAMECSKGTRPADESSLVQEEKEIEKDEEEEEEECAHSFMLEDDLGYVCRVCGVIQRRIETIFDYQWVKGTQTTRTYMPGSRNSNLADIAKASGTDAMEQFLVAADISIHPRHMKQMKPHQIEGFNFLVKNLLGDPPGGCILAHAPGSGKTFMLISFIQSFMAKDPRARPLVVLPKGILATWRKEFQRWQVEDIPMYDFYSSKADNRAQQLEVINRWHDNRSILLLGYKQFANIICEGGSNKVTSACQDKLLKVPTLLILDEGHTPRNDSTDMVDSLAKVKTPCKVVLSGTLFQNHVGEVFNILKLVRPGFMKTESSRAIAKRIMSRVHISGGRKLSKGNQESYLCELVEETLRNDENYKRKIAVIQELRDMTRDVLHYYKGDFLDELPGLVDFTVLLNLGLKQKEVIKRLGKLDKFKKSSLEKAIYVHPRLLELRDTASGDKDTRLDVQKIDAIIGSLNIREGAKAKFFLNLLSMAESSGERVLVFSQYLLPLKFLEILTMRVKGWRTGKEIFVISGDTASDERERSMDQFNSSSDAKVFFGSIKACGEGISLVGASRVVILDVHINPSVTRQAIGRAFRPGQEKKVYIYRLVAADSQEEEDHITSFRKESISKMWFEWSELYGNHDYELDAIGVEESQDIFFENPALREDIKALYIRSAI